MKKIILAISMISVLLLASCSNNEKVENNDLSTNIPIENEQQEHNTNSETVGNPVDTFGSNDTEAINTEHQNEETVIEKTIKNKYIVKRNEPITYTSNGWDSGPDRIGEYQTYSTINIENPNNDENINKINVFLNKWKSYINENVDYKVELPNDIEYYQNFEYAYSEFYQNDRIIVIEEVYRGASGGGAASSSIKYYVFDKSNGNLLTLDDISNNTSTLIEYLFYKPVLDDANMCNNWWNIGLEMSSSLPKDLNEFINSFEGSWAIDENGIVVSRSWAMSGPVYTLKYDINDIKNVLYQNINEEYFE